MKITKKKLEDIIKEEIKNIMAENEANEPTLDQLAMGKIEIEDTDGEALWNMIKTLDAQIKAEKLKGPTKLLPKLQARRKELVRRYELMPDPV